MKELNYEKVFNTLVDKNSRISYKRTISKQWY